MKLTEVFVDREEELAKLEEFHAKASKGPGCVVLLSGRLGTGKTALIDKFLETKRGFYFECVPEQEPYAPLKNFLNAFLSIEKKEIPGSLFLLGQESLESQTLEEAFASLLKFFNSYAVEQALVFAIDNFHDADEGTIKFLDYFVKHLDMARIMIICAYRTEMLEERGKASAITEFLRSLIMNDLFNAVIVDNFDVQRTRLLLAKLFGEDIPNEGVEALYEKSSGNPLLLMEILKILVEENNIDLSKKENWQTIDWEKTGIPESIQEIYQMEIDALSAEAIALLDYMAVLGSEFELDIVSEASGMPLEFVQKCANEMVEKGIIFQDVSSGKYRFTRNIYMEIVYNDIGSKILPICFSLGSAIEKLRKERLSDYAFQLVRLFGNSKDRKKVYEYAIMAAERAEKLRAPESVEKYYELALSLAEEINLGWEERYEIRMKEGMALFYLGSWEKAENCFLEMIKMAKENEDKKREAESILLLVRLRHQQSEYEKARVLLDRAVELAKGSADSRFIAESLRAIAHMEWRRGDYQNALNHYNEALSYFQSASAEAIFMGNIQSAEENIPIKGEILVEMGNVYAEMGDYKQGLLLTLKGFKILKETNSSLMARALQSIGSIHVRDENWAKSAECFRQAIEVAEKWNDLDSLGLANLGLAETLIGSGGNLEIAKEHLEKANSYLSKINDRIGNALLHKTYALLGLKINDLALCENHIKIAEEIAEKIHSPYINAEILRLKIELELKKGERENAKALLGALEGMCMNYKMKSFDKFIEATKKELAQFEAKQEEAKVVEAKKEVEELTETQKAEEEKKRGKRRRKKRGGDMQ